MAGAHLAQEGYLDIVGSVVEDEAQLFLNATRFGIPVVVGTPNRPHPKVLKCTPNQCARCFWDQALTPVRHSNPVAELALVSAIS